MILTKFFALAFLLSALDSTSSQRIVNFKSSGVYFNNLGELNIKNDKFIISSLIDLSGFHNASELIDTMMLNYREFCGTNIVCEGNLVKVENKKREIRSDLNQLYQILGKKVDDRKRRKRFLGVGFGISGMAFGIGQKRSIGQVSSSIDELRSTFEQNMNIVRSESARQSEMLNILKRENQDIANKVSIHTNQLKLNEDKVRILEVQMGELEKSFSEVNIAAVTVDILTTVLDISQKLTKIKQIVIDLQKNSLSTEIISPEEIIRILQTKVDEQKLIETPHLFNYHKIAKTLTGSAYLDISTQAIMIFIEIPLFLRRNHLYEVISVPMIRDHKTLYVSNNDKFCVFTENKRQFYCSQYDHDYLKIDDYYICDREQKISFLPTHKETKCIINIFKSRSFENCNIREISQNIEIFEKLEPNTVLFALRDDTAYNYKCGSDNQLNNGSFTGTGILNLSPGCTFYTENSMLKSDPSDESQYKINSDAFVFGMEKKVAEKFQNHTFSTNISTKKAIVKFSFLKYLRNQEDEDDYQEVGNDYY
ncbi:hypothetical protein ACFFRR_008947 [Megaselia abdita]